MEKSKIFGILVLALFAFAGIAIAATGASPTAISSAAAAPLAGEVAGNVAIADNAGIGAAAVEPIQDPPARDDPRTMHVGDTVATQRLSVRLSDVGAAQGRNNDHPAIFDILDSNNNVVAQITILPRTTYTFTSQDGITLTIRVLATAAGFNQDAKWARVNVRELPGNIRHAGESINGNMLQVRLADVDVAQGRNNGHPAVLDILLNGEVLSQVSVMPGTTYTYRNANLGIVLRISVYETAAGFNMNSKWARLGLHEQALGEILHVGGELNTAHFTARLADIDVAQGRNNDHPAIFDILGRNGNVLAQVTIAEGTQYVFRNNGHRLTIRVYQTAPGFNMDAKWARADIREQ